ncbi:MAG: IS66 family transposase [Planctomycetes bacterium]|nr:IS66 family transposase [Planctomycetota bacterium]
MGKARKTKRKRGSVHRECDARIARLEALVAGQTAELKELKRRLGQDSSNSDKAPSTDPPGKPPKQKRKRGERKPGGQPGHEGRTRALLPPDEVDEIREHKPLACRDCGLKLGGSDLWPQRHQVTEVPPVKPTVVEHRLHSLKCPCGAATRADLPVGVPRGAFGPRLQALVGLLTGAYRISKRNTVQLLSDCFGVDIALGSIKRLEDDLSIALAAPVEAAKDYVRVQPVVGMDETGWSQAGKKAWLWTAVTNLVIVFTIRFSRGSKVAKGLVGEDYGGVVVSDRWSGYKWIPVKRRQFCWAHLKRDFQKIAESGGELAAIGEALQVQRKQLFKWWHRVRDGTLARSSFQTYVNPLRKEVCKLLRQGEACTEENLSGMCSEILKLEAAMWTFVRVAGVEPTNNESERALRHAVIWRKTSFGTHSEGGSTFVERILTVVASLRLQRRSVLDYLTEACEGALQGRVGPSLLPPDALAGAQKAA